MGDAEDRLHEHGKAIGRLQGQFAILIALDLTIAGGIVALVVKVFNA